MEILIAIVSFLLGYVAQKVLDSSISKIGQARNIKKIRKAVNQHQQTAYRDITVTCEVLPYFSAHNVVVKSCGEQKFFLAPPSDLQPMLSDFQSQDSIPFNISLPNVSSAEIAAEIETARREIAQMFLNREDGLYFNGSKYGVMRLDGFSRTPDIAENPILTLEVFTTDHYTHRVISRALERLSLHPKAFSPERLNTDLSWIRTSLGLSIIVIVKSSNQIILTRRSTNASFTEGKNWIYVSSTETFSETDFDAYREMPDLLLCVKRGVYEELGITAQMYSDQSIRFYDCFFENHFYQDGIVVSIELNAEVTADQVLSLKAKDGQLEIAKKFLVNNDKRAINHFIEENESEMRSQTIFALKSYMARMNLA